MYIKISEDKAVKPVKQKPDGNDWHQMEHWEVYINTLPTFEVPESMRPLPVGSELEVREQKQLDDGNFDWFNCTDIEYEKSIPKYRRIILVPCEQGEEEFIDSVVKQNEAAYSEYPKRQTEERVIGTIKVSDAHPPQEAPEQGVEAKEMEQMFAEEAESNQLGSHIAKWLEEQSKHMKVGERYTYPDVCDLIQNYIESLPTLQPKGMTREDAVLIILDRTRKTIIDGNEEMIDSYRCGMCGDMFLMQGKPKYCPSCSTKFEKTDDVSL